MKHVLVGLLLALLFTGYACKKKKITKGNVIITVTYNGQTLPDARVYMKAGTLSDPGLPYAQYDDYRDCVNGSAFFTDLPEGDYFFKATATSNGNSLDGITAASVIAKEDFNRYERKIFLK